MSEPDPQALADAGMLAFRQGTNDDARALLSQSLALAGSLGDLRRRTPSSATMHSLLRGKKAAR